MPQPKIEYVITTLAEYQTEFWAAVAQKLIATGAEVSLISFDDNSTTMLQRENLRTYNLSRSDWQVPLARNEIDAKLHDVGLTDTAFWYTHEKANFGERSDRVLDERLYRYIRLCEQALADVSARGHKAVMVQELGGFLSVIAAFFTARKAGVDNWFIEPSFFKGRCLWLKNTFSSYRVAPGAKGANPEVAAYLEAAVREKTIVIPLKDRHQYRSPLAKIVSFRNAWRVAEKVLHKYVLGRRQEFGHVWTHTGRHIAMIVSYFQLKSVYRTPEPGERFIYYPFHVPGDMALTLRSPQYLDQLSLVDLVARQLPRGYRLVTKEHPAMIGAIGAGDLRRLLRRQENVLLAPPHINNYELLGQCAALVSVNSKSGAEAALLGKSVLVLGDAFYRESGLTIDLDSPLAIGAALRTAVSEPKKISDRDRLGFFTAIWENSHPGELYVSAPDNLKNFTGALLAATGN